MFHVIFKEQDLAEYKKRYLNLNNEGEENWNKGLRYVAAFFGQLGNYKSFGATKFIPEIGADDFYKLFEVSLNYAQNQTLIDELWNSVKDIIYLDKN